MSRKHVITAIIKDRKGRTLSIAQNSYIKTHTLQAYHANKVGLPEKQFLHAEVHAITKVRDLTKAHSISIFRYGANGNPIKAAPCPICQSAIEAAGIKIIIHT